MHKGDMAWQQIAKNLVSNRYLQKCKPAMAVCNITLTYDLYVLSL